MQDNAIITATEIDRLIQYLEFFQGPADTFCREVNGYTCEAETILAFRKELYDTGFLIVFDWGAWIREYEIYKDIDGDIEEHIMSADLETLRKLVTSYIRGDRFMEGLFLAVAMNGKIAQVLTRLQQFAYGGTEENES
ncbi:hypothetical protein J23TS9_23330 [Paenibacillus sp. J23TS9]|uniref:DUF6508 domain-containing protein n=1 Tax=Paenibacillus sp. J23TS9 TaxID=2807193 RepID=UPI001B2D2418|nr:DUF6508 domain-containing protein [Paenibacillus sp. J23TS9]GIP27203.1 hypothetical protein J23TS9_23330 [Paenibacillus sp. J23TS9]